ncbi:MAG: hypothetical protein M2R45_04570 [Verrucomicrobia subdivision 3 bacterium]|nr:hypothetical protein [Limisphaerales bacterium]MCS1417345.1 hypothetical protein [Limisphaerales bacterium]
MLMSFSRKATGLLVGFLMFGSAAMGTEIDFNRDIRSILSNNCLTCHGPDPAERKADLRLDIQDGSRADLGGYAAIRPGDPEASELLRRVTTADEDDRMPPAKSGPRLSLQQISLLRQWIKEGATYAQHWAYVKPRRPSVSGISRLDWVRNPIDYFVLAKLDAVNLSPSEDADRWALARRAAIDLTGVPPSLDEVEAFLTDQSPLAYERYVDALLHKDAFGERWARVWLDLARYADSAGYADDPPRTIWGYRDYVIRALNDNMPFDQFTVEQLAGDLLPNPTTSQLVATAFHRNTMTNNEGGTNDEQFRNEAIIDRVNTTMQVWMGTTMACAQCHNHKYDPISQEEYFKFFAFFNNTQDSDKRSEEPVLSLYTEMQKKQRNEWQDQIEKLKWQIERPNDVVDAEQRAWETRMSEPPVWEIRHPREVSAVRREIEVTDKGLVRAHGVKPDKETYRVHLQTDGEKAIEAIRLDIRAQEEKFALSQVQAVFHPDKAEPVAAQFIRIELPGKGKILSLAEVEVIRDGDNIATSGEASQSSTAYQGDARLAIDGNRDGNYSAKSTTHTATTENPWWELDLGDSVAVDELSIWSRTDGGPAISGRLAGFHLKLLSSDRAVVWENSLSEVPLPGLTLAPSGARLLKFSAAVADYGQKRSGAASVLTEKLDPKKAWIGGGQTQKAHQLTLVLAASLVGDAGTIILTLRQESEHARRLIDAFTVSTAASPQISEHLRLPDIVREALAVEPGKRSPEQTVALAAYHRTVSPTLRPYQERLARVEKQLKEYRPYTTVPIFRELAPEKRRKTHIQVRGNHLNKKEEVFKGTPAVFHPLAESAPKNRLSLAKWLVSEENPLTARVIANRHWEQLFGTGIVPTSEEFGSQGELPSHPKLLDWLAVELMDSGWDLKHLIKLITTSATYRQSTKVTPAMLEADPSNRFFTRGPRIRLSAEMIRDQALFIGGLLCNKKYGPPSRPPQPKTGLSAAFGSGIDWETSKGGDKYRRGLYTKWRRSNPYPSMTTFDAPNREVCTVRRPRSNTPLQALVTLNDPVYVEAAQGLARRIAERDGSAAAKVDWAFRTALIRPPTEAERDRLIVLYESAKREYGEYPELAREMATNPLGDPRAGAELADLAAWTVVGNVILNLDEIFLKR